MEHASRRWVVVVAAFCMVFYAQPASTQIGIEDLFKSVTDVSFFSSCWNTNSAAIQPTDKCPFGEHAFGFETSFRIKTVSLKPSTDSVTSRAAREIRIRVEPGKPNTTDSVFDVKESRTPRGLSVLFELGLGYAQYSGFSSQDSTLELRGSVREIPAVTVYATLESSSPASGWKAWRNAFGAYLGLRTGLAKLQDVQVLLPVSSGKDSVVVYAGDAQTFQIGAVEGITFEPPPLKDRITFYGEWAQMYRNFTSVKWGATGTNIPTNIPRNLDFSGNSFSLGVQIHIPK